MKQVKESFDFSHFRLTVTCSTVGYEKWYVCRKTTAILLRFATVLSLLQVRDIILVVACRCGRVTMPSDGGCLGAFLLAHGSSSTARKCRTQGPSAARAWQTYSMATLQLLAQSPCCLPATSSQQVACQMQCCARPPDLHPSPIIFQL